MSSLRYYLNLQPDNYVKKQEYKMGKVIGEGSFGIVRAATKLDTKEEVAIKVILKSRVKDQEDMVWNELKLVKDLNHPNIISFVDWFESLDKYYMIFERALGGELFDRLCDFGKFSEKDASFYVKQILEAVEYLHDNNLVHRDLKPENLIFKEYENDSHIALCDFGISKIVKEDEMTTTVCGSHGYAAPEVYQRTGYDSSVDMWSIGLAGYAPFNIYDGSDYINDMKNENYDFDHKVWTHITPEAKEFIRSLLKASPMDRLSAKEALHHKWITGDLHRESNLVNKRPAFNAKNTYKRALNKLKLISFYNAHLSDDDSDTNQVLDEGIHKSMEKFSLND